uniref:Ig-like domain-containing protein n=1 Tax=Acanthochromis polyacanthus TaxID=80966 RepID=A0A3Q1EQS0_9TELE
NTGISLGSFCMYKVLTFTVFLADANCAYKPVFTPSRLVVKYGDPTSATCVACVGVCNKHFGLEKPVGDVTVNGTTLSWTVGRLTEWDASPMCFYNTESGDQCCTVLPVTVYQPPENVSISFENHAGPMFEHNQYTLDKEDDGAQYWCEAKLELGPEGPQPPPVNTGNLEPIKITEGQSLQLNCSAVGNPSPSYEWTIPPDSQSYHSVVFDASFSVVTIKSVGFEHKGQYTCNVSSEDRTESVTFTVDVQGEFHPSRSFSVVSETQIKFTMTLFNILHLFDIYCSLFLVSLPIPPTHLCRQHHPIHYTWCGNSCCCDHRHSGNGILWVLQTQQSGTVQLEGRIPFA